MKNFAMQHPTNSFDIIVYVDENYKFLQAVYSGEEDDIIFTPSELSIVKLEIKNYFDLN